MTQPMFWRRRSVRRWAIQCGFVAFLLGVVLTGIATARANLAAQGLTSGFDFLWKATGWELNFSLLGARPADPYWWYLLNGIVNTLFLGVIGLVLATAIGLIVGLARTSVNAPARLIGTVYVEVFRNIPLIVQVFFWYAIATRLPAPREAWQVAGTMISSRGLYVPVFNISSAALAGSVAVVAATAALALWLALARRFNRGGNRQRLVLVALGLGAIVTALIIVTGRLPATPLLSLPALKGLNIRGGLRIQPELYALAFAIAIYGGAYIGEVVRGGFKSVGRGQTEAARALGLTPWQVFSRVRLPLAVRAMLPILINQYVWLIKATTLGITIGFADFFMVIAGSITHSGQTLEFIGILMAGFLVINFTLAAALNRINRSIALKGNQIGVAQ